MNLRSHHKGFTLLEVVVAVALLGVGVGVAMQIFSGGLKNIHRIKMAHAAMHHAENVMNEILADQSIVGPVQLSGTLDEDFSYTADVIYWEPNPEELSLEIVEKKLDLLGVQVEVHFAGDDSGKTYRVVSLKAVPREPLPGGVGGSGIPDPIQQLFGRR